MKKPTTAIAFIIALIASIIALTVLALGGFLAIRMFEPPELTWRFKVLAAKVRGDIPQIPLGSLIVWLTPRGPFNLMPLADNPNPHAAIHNRLTTPKNVKQGE